MTRVTTQAHRHARGLTLVEVMIAMFILAVVSSQALGMLSSQLHTFHAQRRVLDAQEDSRMIADMILVDIRMAGFMVPKIAGIASVDGGPNGTDWLCTSEWGSLDDTEVSNASSPFDGASLTAAVGGGNTTVSLAVTELDIDGDGGDDFADDMGIIISDGAMTHCGRITNVAGGTVTFTPSAPAGFVVAIGSVAVPAVVYEVAAGSLLRNNNVLSQIEDLQVEFGVDNDGDGLLGVGEFPLDTLNGSDISAIRTVQLSVLTRTAVEDAKLIGAGRQQVANHAAAAAADDFRRRLVTVSAAPRNLL